MLCVPAYRDEGQTFHDSNILEPKDLERFLRVSKLLAGPLMKITRGKYGTFGKIDRWVNLGGLY